MLKRGARPLLGPPGRRAANSPSIIEFVSANPTRPLPRRLGPSRRLRRCARERSSNFHGHEVQRPSTTSTTPARSCASSASGWRGARARRGRSRGAAQKGDYVAELARGDPRLRDRGSRPPRAGRRSRRCLERSARRSRASGVQGHDQRVQRALASTSEISSAVQDAPSRRWRRAGAPPRPRARSGAHDEVRRRERPRRGARERRADLLRLRHRLPYDKRARGFDGDRRLRRRPPRLHRARGAASQALGGDPEEIEILIVQFVTSSRAASRSAMSTRRGDRHARRADRGDRRRRDALLLLALARDLDLDLDLAREQSTENPVFYIQYAHARIALDPGKAGERASRRRSRPAARTGRRRRSSRRSGR